MESGLADSDDESAIEHLTLPRRDPVPVSRGGRGRKLKFLNQVNAEDLAMALKVPALEPSQKSKSEPKQKAQSSEEKSESLNVFGPIAHMPTVGSDLQHRYCQVVSNALQNGIDYEDSLIESMFSHTHSSASSIAKFNECSLSRVKTAVIECGCAAVYGGGWLTGSLCCCIGKMISEGSWRPVAFFRCTRYDETPTKVRLPKEAGPSRSDEVAETTDVVEHAKVLQTEFQVVFLVHDEEKGEYLLIRAFVPTTLQALDRTTAENTKSCLNQTMSRVPELARVGSMFPFRVHHACTDKYSANLKTEKAIKSEEPDYIKHHVLCYVHRLATAITAANSLFPDETAGILSVALACREVGSAGKLRDLLRQIFREKLEIKPYRPREVWTQHRLQIYDLFLPLHGDGKWRNLKRRFILNHFLNGNLEDASVVHHFCPYNHCSSEQDVRNSFANQVAWALLPEKPPKYSRGRWVNYDRAIMWCGLLEAHHSLLQQVILRYTGKPQKQAVAHTDPAAIQDKARPHGHDMDSDDDTDNKWAGLMQELMQDESAPAGDKDAHDEADDQTADQTADDHCSGFNWIEFNRRQKAQAGSFVSSNPLANIAIMQQVCRHLLAVMHCFLMISGDEWEKQQERLSSQGKDRSYRALECAKGTAVKEAFDALTQSLDKLPIALPTLCHTRGHRNNLFAMISKGLCALHQLVRMDHKGCPFSLFAALDKGLPSIRETPPCMYDELTQAYADHFLGIDHIVDAEAALESLAIVTHTDIAKIECRHSSNRDLTMLRGSGWTPSLSVISAKFACGTFKSAHPKIRARVKKSVLKKAKCKRPGGAWRAFLSCKLRSQRWNEDPQFGGQQLTMKELANEYHSLSVEEKTFFVEMGQLATIAGRHGFKPFGVRSRARRPRALLPDTIEPGTVTKTGAIALGDRDPDLALAEWTGQPFATIYDDFQKQLLVARAESRPIPQPEDDDHKPPPSLSNMIDRSACHAHAKAFVSSATSFQRCEQTYKLHSVKWKAPVEEFSQAG